MKEITRCPWKNLETSPLYLEYHDKEWGVASYEDRYLFEMLVLESFQCGLSWLTVLKKRESFRENFHGFQPEIIANYGDEKIAELLENKDIIRSKGKILATVNNANCFLKVQKEFGTFSEFIWSFTQGEVEFFQTDDPFITTNETSDKVSKELKKRGFRYVGSVVTFSYLEAIGVMNHHHPDCFCYKGKNHGKHGKHNEI